MNWHFADGMWRRSAIARHRGGTEQKATELVGRQPFADDVRIRTSRQWPVFAAVASSTDPAKTDRPECPSNPDIVGMGMPTYDAKAIRAD